MHGPSCTKSLAASPAGDEPSKPAGTARVGRVGTHCMQTACSLQSSRKQRSEAVLASQALGTDSADVSLNA